MTEQRGPERVKVVDRRRFTPEGELRAGVEACDEPPASAAEKPVETPPAATPLAPEQQEEPRVALPSRVLLDVVDYMAQYAMAFLTGQVAGLNRDPRAAKLFIDLLTAVKERTSGQASLQETKVLEDVLNQLRLQYMAAPR